MIKKRNLDNSLIQWIMTQTGLGPGIGEIFYVAPVPSATSQYRTQLQSNNIATEIDATIAAAYAKMVTHRNDVMLVMPGWYSTPSFEWGKSHAHCLGLSDSHVTGTNGTGATVIYQSVATAAYTMDMSGAYNVFQNIAIHHYGNAATSLSALKLNGTNSRFQGCDLLGIGGTTAGADRDCAVLWVPALSDHGAECRFNNCGIRDANAARTSTEGGLVLFGTFGETGGNCGKNMQFNDCRLISRSEATGAHMVAIASPMDGLIEWAKCTFYNHSVNQGNTMLAAFGVNASGTYVHILRQCSFPRIAEVQITDTGYIYTVDADAADTGGIPNEAT